MSEPTPTRDTRTDTKLYLPASTTPETLERLTSRISQLVGRLYRAPETTADEQQ